MRPTYLCVCARARRRRAKREQGREVSLVDSHNWKRRKEHNHSWNNGTQTSKRSSISRFGKENNNARDAHALSKNFAFFVAFFIACFATTTLSTAIIIIASPPKSLCVGGWSAVAVVVVVVSSREMPPTSTSSSFLRRLASLIRLRRLFRPPRSRLVICF